MLFELNTISYIAIIGTLFIGFIQGSVYSGLWFIQGSVYSDLQFIQVCGLFRVLFRQISLYKINNLQHLINSKSPYGYSCSQKLLNYLSFHSFDFERHLMKVILEACSAQ